ncbi:hypothetical protein D3C72_2018330 [compost metagenome]
MRIQRQVRRGGEQHGIARAIAIAACGQQRVDRDAASRAGLVFNDEGIARCPHAFGQRTGHQVGRAARGKTHQHA